MNQLSPLYTSPSKLAATVSTNHTHQEVLSHDDIITNNDVIMHSWEVLSHDHQCQHILQLLHKWNQNVLYKSGTHSWFVHPFTSFRLSSLILVVFFVASGSCPADEASCTSSFFLSASPHCLVIIWLASPYSGLPLLEPYLSSENEWTGDWLWWHTERGTFCTSF